VAQFFFSREENKMKRTRSLSEIIEDIYDAEDVLLHLKEEKHEHPDYIAKKKRKLEEAAVEKLRRDMIELSNNLSPWLLEKFTDPDQPASERLRYMAVGYEKAVFQIDGDYVDILTIRLEFENGFVYEHEELMSPRDNKPQREIFGFPEDNCSEIRYSSEEVLWCSFIHQGNSNMAHTLCTLALAAWCSRNDPLNEDTSIAAVWNNVWNANTGKKEQDSDE
jgi:hypothetical protein